MVRLSQSPYSSYVLLVRRADGSWKMSIDYRAINAVTFKYKYPNPIMELLDELYEAEYISKLDLGSGYHQIKVKP